MGTACTEGVADGNMFSRTFVLWLNKSSCITGMSLILSGQITRNAIKSSLNGERSKLAQFVEK